MHLGTFNLYASTDAICSCLIMSSIKFRSCVEVMHIESLGYMTEFMNMGRLG